MNGLHLVARLWSRRGTDDATPLDVLFEPGFVAIDLETTGPDARRDVVVSVAAIPFERGRACEGFVSLVAPGRPIPPDATAIHGIDDAAVAAAPAIGAVLPRFHAVCGQRLVVGHDVGFDLSVLARSRFPMPAPAWAALDTRRLARALGHRDTRLERVAASVHVAVNGRHSADGDARMAGEILLALLPALRDAGVRTLGELRRLQRSAPLHD